MSPGVKISSTPNCLEGASQEAYFVWENGIGAVCLPKTFQALKHLRKLHRWLCKCGGQRDSIKTQNGFDSQRKQKRIPVAYPTCRKHADHAGVALVCLSMKNVRFELVRAT